MWQIDFGLAAKWVWVGRHGGIAPVTFAFASFKVNLRLGKGAGTVWNEQVLVIPMILQHIHLISAFINLSLCEARSGHSTIRR